MIRRLYEFAFCAPLVMLFPDFDVLGWLPFKNGQKWRENPDLEDGKMKTPQILRNRMCL